jgi:inosine-uridine nucleoside N-ribohydrolase
MINKLIQIAFILFLTFSPSFSQVKIIFDTDIGGDADDLGALAMLHNFVSKGECELLGVMCWSKEKYAVPAIDAINRYYKHPDIPIGIRPGVIFSENWHHGKAIADKFSYKLKAEDAPDATYLYRKLLAQSKDKSVVIVAVGPLMNIQNLIKSMPDSLSKLTGKELIKKKVKEFVIMGGNFPAGENEWNFNGQMPGVTKFVINNISVPITFSGFEVGRAIQTGDIFNTIDSLSPLYVGYMYFSQNAPWRKQEYKGKILSNSTFDQTAVLYAVRKGVGTYWDKIKGGYCEADENGGNKWIQGGSGKHSYLKLKMDPKKMEKLIESIMLGNF